MKVPSYCQEGTAENEFCKVMQELSDSADFFDKLTDMINESEISDEAIISSMIAHIIGICQSSGIDMKTFNNMIDVSKEKYKNILEGNEDE